MQYAIIFNTLPPKLGAYGGMWRAHCSEKDTVWFGGGRLETQVMLCAGCLPYSEVCWGVGLGTAGWEGRRGMTRDPS
jgi:hypothetical protein